MPSQCLELVCRVAAAASLSPTEALGNVQATRNSNHDMGTMLSIMLAAWLHQHWPFWCSAQMFCLDAETHLGAASFCCRA